MVPFKQIDTKEAYDLIAKENPIIVDIRDEQSYQSAHIPNAVQINDQNVEQFISEHNQEKRALLCYCYHGISSQQAAQYFAQNGFHNVYSLLGGFEQWKESYPFEAS